MGEIVDPISLGNGAGGALLLVLGKWLLDWIRQGRSSATVEQVDIVKLRADQELVRMLLDERTLRIEAQLIERTRVLETKIDSLAERLQAHQDKAQ